MPSKPSLFSLRRRAPLPALLPLLAVAWGQTWLRIQPRAPRASLLRGAGPPPMRDADIYRTPVDARSGDLNLSSVPEEPGVYCIYDKHGIVQYIGVSKNIRNSVQNHADVIGIQSRGAIIAGVKCSNLPGASKALLVETWEAWLEDHISRGGKTPAGNLPEGSKGADPRWRVRKPQVKKQLELKPPKVKRKRVLPAVAKELRHLEALKAVGELIEKTDVVLFMRGSPSSPRDDYSESVSSLLREVGIDFESVDVLDEAANPGVQEAVKEFGKWPKIPQLYARGKLVGGVDIIEDLYRTGELHKLPPFVRLVDDPRRPKATALCAALASKLELHGLEVIDETPKYEEDLKALDKGKISRLGLVLPPSLSRESHFKLQVVSPDFAGQAAVERQQKVYEAISDVMPQIQALSVVALTPEEEAEEQKSSQKSA